MDGEKEWGSVRAESVCRVPMDKMRQASKEMMSRDQLLVPRMHVQLRARDAQSAHLLSRTRHLLFVFASSATSSSFGTFSKARPAAAMSTGGAAADALGCAAVAGAAAAWHLALPLPPGLRTRFSNA
eukprot:4171760-Pleurochrysis_carterae.AAC.1